MTTVQDQAAPAEEQAATKAEPADSQSSQEETPASDESSTESDEASENASASQPAKAPADEPAADETPAAGDDAVCKIGETEYTALDDAVKAAADGDTIIVLKDCTTDGLNLSKNLTITGAEGSKPSITFTKYGIALWSKSLTFKDCSVTMNGIGSTPYTAEWKWMTICAAANSALTLDNVDMSMDGAGAGDKHAIYFTGNDALNIINGSDLTIKNYKQDALEWDGGNGGYNLNIKDSAFTADHNRSGLAGTFDATFDNSTVNVVNSTGNGSNGSNFTIKNKSVINFNNNGSHGLSAGTLSIDDSTVTANGNGGNGIHATGTTEFKNNSTVTVQNNKCSIISKWTMPGAIQLEGDTTITGSKVVIQGNGGSGIYQKTKGKTLIIDPSADVTIVKNTAEKLGYGGGIYVNGTANLADNVVLYNNHAGTAGDDIYLPAGASIKFGETGSDWKLDGAPDCEDAIDGWYDDAANLRWEAHAENASGNYIKQVKAGTRTGSLALKAAHGLKPDPVDPGNIDNPGWDKSKSKTATNLDGNMISEVTLSLPSAEKELTTDIVFVLDKSTIKSEAKDKTLQLLQDLKKQVDGSKAKVNVGVVIFNNKATAANDGNFFDLETQYSDIEAAINTELYSGTNTHAGLLSGEKMLDGDTSVDASRKYLIFVSDAITYIYNEDPTCTAWCYAEKMDPNYWKNAYIWQEEYGSAGYVPSDWHKRLSEVGGKVANQGTAYEFRYDQPIPADQPRTDWKTSGTFASSPDVALYKTYKEYQKIASKYHTYAVPIGTTTDLAWGPSFMDYLAGGEAVSFDKIKKDISYLVDAGSYVDDYMGCVDGDYNFDLADPAAITIKVGGETLKAEKISENKYGFGKNEEGGYKYMIEYTPGDKKAEEHFRWTTNVPVSNFAQVQIIYQVKLTNPKTAPGTYGQYDEDGSRGYGALYTNNQAILTPVDTSGKEGAKEAFAKPTVSYTVAQPVTPADPAPVTAADPPVKKVVKGDKPAVYPAFDFVITPVSTTAAGLAAATMPMPEKTRLSITGPGSAEFGNITFSREGTYVYSISETAGIEDGWTYDRSSCTVTYKVTKSADGRLLTVQRTITKDGSAADDVVFTNTYREPAPEPTNLTIEAQKKLIGRDLEEGEFKFQLKGRDENGQPFKVTARNEEDGAITFPELHYTKPGSYTYTVSEVSGNAKGITYDSSAPKVKVTVTKNADGELVAAADYGSAGKIVFTNKYSKTGNGDKDKKSTADNKGKTDGSGSTNGDGPKTGDPSNLTGYLIVLAGAACLLLAIPAYRRRKNRQ